MVIDPKRTTVAYRCSDCMAGVQSVVGLFRLSADMIKLKCPCKKSEMQVVYNKNTDQVRLKIHCLFCDKPHNFNVNSSLFFNTELFVLPCPYTGLNIGFVGESNNVKAELARSELELLEMIEEFQVDYMREKMNEVQSLPDPQVKDVVMYFINELDAEGKIYCKCFPDGREPLPDGEFERKDSNYDVEITDDGIEITCNDCHCSTVIPTDSLLRAQEFFECDFIKLE